MDNVTYTKPIPWIIPQLPEDIVKIFLNRGRVKTYKKDDIVIDENSRMDYLFYINSGLLSQAVVNFNLNKPLAMNVFIPGRMMGYLNFFTHTNSPRRIISLEKSEILVVPFDEMREIIEKDFALYKTFVAYCELCRKSELNGMIGLFSSAAEDRLKLLFVSLLCSYGYDFDRGDNEDWAKVPVNLRRDDIIKIIYTSKLTLDRLLSDWIKNDLLRREGRDYYVRPLYLKDIYDWILTV